jgi:hypothetical protein
VGVRVGGNHWVGVGRSVSVGFAIVGVGVFVGVAVGVVVGMGVGALTSGFSASSKMPVP